MTKRTYLAVLLTVLLLMLIAVIVLRLNAADQVSPAEIEELQQTDTDITEQTGEAEDFSDVSEGELKEKLVDIFPRSSSSTRGISAIRCRIFWTTTSSRTSCSSITSTRSWRISRWRAFLQAEAPAAQLTVRSAQCTVGSKLL